MNIGVMIGVDKEVGICMWGMGVWGGKEGRICFSKVIKMEYFFLNKVVMFFVGMRRRVF